MDEKKSDYTKPLPVIQPESEFFWQKAKEHELWLRKCNSCNATYHYPRDICPICHDKNVEWVITDGKGTLYAFSIVHRSPPPFKDSVPYVLALVEMDGGARILSNLVNVEPEPAHIKIGMALEVVFDDVTENISLPKFRPSGA